MTIVMAPARAARQTDDDRDCCPGPPPVIMIIKRSRLILSTTRLILSTTRLILSTIRRLFPAGQAGKILTTDEHRLVERFSQRNGIPVDWAVEGEPEPLLPAQANALYRIAEEALRNVERHAEASRLTVRLSYADGVALNVQDDGEGFDPEVVEPNRYGLVGIRERAALVDGQVTVVSAPNEGTTLTVRIVEPWED